MHSLLNVSSLYCGISFFHHRGQAQRLARRGQLRDLIDAGKEAAMEELRVEEVVDGDVSVGGHDMDYDLS